MYGLKKSHQFQLSLQQEIKFPKFLGVDLKPRRKMYDHAYFVGTERHGKIAVHEDWSSNEVVHVSAEC